MSFRCGNCKKNTEPRQPVNTVVLVKRPQQYNNYIRGNTPDKGYWKNTVGEEIVREIRACPPCYGKLTGLEPKVALAPIQPDKVENTERPKREFNRPRRRAPVDKTNPNWKYKQELDEIKRRESHSKDPRGEVQKRTPVVEKVQRIAKK